MAWFFVWLIGIVITYLIGKYFEWDAYDHSFSLDGRAGPGLFTFSGIWPVALPIYLLMLLGDKLSELGKARREKLEQRRRFRIVEQNRQQRLLEQSEREVEEYMSRYREDTDVK